MDRPPPRVDPDEDRTLETDRPARDDVSQNEEVKPFHAKEAATGQEAADVVAAVLKHAAERDEAAKQRTVIKQQAGWMLPLGATLGVLASYLLIFSPPWLELNPIDPPPIAAQLEDLRAGMYFEIVKIETYRINNGRLPATLREAGAGEGVPGLDYSVRGDSSYVLISSVGDETVVFNSGEDDPNEWVGNLAAKIGG